MNKYKNRYGDTYYYEATETPNLFKFVMEGISMNYCRFGGHEYQTEVDNRDLGFFDPSGGPFVSVGSTIPVGVVRHIFMNDADLFIVVLHDE